MKRIFTLLLLLFITTIATFAQNMSVESFVRDEMDQDARVAEPELDQNGRTRALIKVETTQRGFVFDTGMSGYGLVKEKVGQLWVYVPSGVMRLEISHPQLGTMTYHFPMAISEATVYRMKLTTARVTQIVEQGISEQYLRLKVTPADAEASLSIDGGVSVAIVNGELASLLPLGEHRYQITSELYKAASGVVTIGSDGGYLNVALEANYGYFSINSTPAAKVSINGLSVGMTPYRSDKMALGDYQIKLSAQNYGEYSAPHSLVTGGETVSVSPELSSYFSAISLSVGMVDAQISINKEPQGIGSWEGELLPGIYEIECSKEGHRSSVRTITVEQRTPQTISLASPTPMYGRLNVNSSQLDVEVSIDGARIGVAPNIFSNILCGTHRLTLSKEGFTAVETTIEISEGKITEYKLDQMQSVKETAEYKAALAAAEAAKNLPRKVFNEAEYKKMGSPEELDIPYGYTEIEQIWNWSKNGRRDAPVQTVTIPISVTSIGYEAFYYCDNLTSITIPNSVTSIGEKAFYSCDNLTSITIPNSVTSIGYVAFYSCKNLTSITIPNSVVSIGGGAFNGLSNNVTIVMNSPHFKYSGGAIYSADGKTIISVVNIPSNFTIPNSVTSIRMSAFTSCDNLTSITIPNSVTSIGNNAFSWCDNLTSITIPNSVTSIGGDAFHQSKYTRNEALIVYISKSNPSYKKLKEEYKEREFTKIKAK